MDLHRPVLYFDPSGDLCKFPKIIDWESVVQQDVTTGMGVAITTKDPKAAAVVASVADGLKNIWHSITVMI